MLHNYRKIFFVIISLVAIFNLDNNFISLTANSSAPQQIDDVYVQISLAQVRERRPSYQILLGGETEAEAYLDVYYESDKEGDGKIIAVESELFRSFRFYHRKDAGRVGAKEDPVDSIPLPQFKVTHMAYVGYNIRLYGIEKMPAVGTKFPITLILEGNKKFSTEADVVATGLVVK